MSTTQPTGSYDVNAEEPDLLRVMGPKLLLLFIVGDILGTGVYALTGQVAGEVGGAAWAPFLVAFVVATITAFSYLELVTKYPQAAGAALYTHKAFGIHFFTFLVAFTVMCSGITSASTASNAFAGFLNDGFDLGFEVGGTGLSNTSFFFFFFFFSAAPVAGLADGRLQHGGARRRADAAAQRAVRPRRRRSSRPNSRGGRRAPSAIRWTEVRAKPVRNVAGLMTGTSMDGLDVALCRIRSTPPLALRARGLRDRAAAGGRCAAALADEGCADLGASRAPRRGARPLLRRRAGRRARTPSGSSST